MTMVPFFQGNANKYASPSNVDYDDNVVNAVNLIIAVKTWQSIIGSPHINYSIEP